jgi:arylsulfatase
MYKHWVHEGGISTPLIAHSAQRPAKAESPGARAGSSDRRHGDLRRRERSQASRSRRHESDALLHSDRGTLAARPKGALCWEHEGNRAVRDGPLETGVALQQPKQMGALRYRGGPNGDERSRRLQRSQASELQAKWDAWACARRSRRLGHRIES